MRFDKLKVSEIKSFLDKQDFNTCDINSILKDLRSDNRSSVQKLMVSFKKRYDNHFKDELLVEEFYNFDRQYIEYDNYVIAGCDEVGRGPLAGPIVCASVVLDLHNREKIINKINDSKKLKSRALRKELSEMIKDRAKKFKIVSISNEQIDKIGIGVANQKGFKSCIEELGINIDLVLSDGYPIKNLNFKNIPIIKGDTKSASIMCASIISKVYRDELLVEYHNEFPEYNFLNNVGYGTKEHVEAIKRYGICKYHRKSFLKNILNVIVAIFVIFPKIYFH